MKKTKLIGLVAATALVTGLSAATPTKLSQEQLTNIKDKTPLFKNKNITITKGYDRSDVGLYQLETVFKTPRGSSVIPAYLDKKTNVIFVGSAYLPNGEKLSMPVERKTIDNGIALTYCPYCQKLEKEKGKDLDNYKVHVVLFPLSFHQHAKPMTQWILRGKTDKEKAERMKAIANGSKEWAKDIGFDMNNYRDEYRDYILVLNSDGTNIKNQKVKERIEAAKKKYFKNEAELKEFRDYLEKSAKAFREVGARGTPTLKDATFNTVNPGTL